MAWLTARCPVVDTSTCVVPSVEQYPAASRPSPASTNAATMAARWSGVAPAVPSSQWSTTGTGAGGAKPANSGSGGRRAAAASARSTSASRLAASVRVVCARATLPSTATVSDIASRSSVTF